MHSDPVRLALLALLVGVLALPPTAAAQAPGCSNDVAPQPRDVDARGVSPGSPNPLSGLSFFLDTAEPAMSVFGDLLAEGRRSDAALLWKVASQPRFNWFGRFTGTGIRSRVGAYLDRVRCEQPGRVPLMAVLRHQGQECHAGYDGGGPAEDRATMRWYDDFARAIGGTRVVIGFEPDSLGTIDCLMKSRRGARLRVLRYGVRVLSALPRATIYLEAGASDWEPAERMAKRLRYIGIARVRGFMLNVTHYDWTANNVRYGRRVSRLVGGKPFIVSTAFNGRGPVHLWKRQGRRRVRLNVWCHPMRRGLGPLPTTRTGQRGVDAYMWIGRPGYSGGSCNGGPTPIGTFWPERALMLARYATGWVRPPRGTHDGLPRRYSRRDLGYCGPPCT